MKNTLRGHLVYKGERGDSAYEIAVQEGFQGNKETWLNQIGFEEINAKLPANVKDFGAIGDGVTDDTEAIQNAINFAQSKLYFPEGIYLLSTPLELVSDLYMYGEGTLKSEGTTTTTRMFNINNVSNVTINGLKFETTLNSKDCSDFNRSSEYLWSNKIALSVSNSNKISILNSKFKNFEYAFKIDGEYGFNTDVLIDNCKIDVSPMAIYVSHTDGFIVRNSKIKAVDYGTKFDHHIYGSEYCKNHIIENCELIDGAGIPIHYIDGYDNNNVEGIYHAENIIISNISLIETVGGIVIARQGSYMSAFNIIAKSSKNYADGVFESFSGAKLVVNNVNIDCPQMSILSSTYGSDSSLHIIGGYMNVRYGINNTITDNNKVVLKNLELDISDKIIAYSSADKIINLIIENCNIRLNKISSNTEPISVRSGSSSLQFINNTVLYTPLDGQVFVYNTANGCGNFIFANNVIKGFSSLIYDSGASLKDHNNCKV